LRFARGPERPHANPWRIDPPEALDTAEHGNPHHADQPKPPAPAQFVHRNTDKRLRHRLPREHRPHQRAQRTHHRISIFFQKNVRNLLTHPTDRIKSLSFAMQK